MWTKWSSGLVVMGHSRRGLDWYAKRKIAWLQLNMLQCNIWGKNPHLTFSSKLKQIFAFITAVVVVGDDFDFDSDSGLEFDFVWHQMLQEPWPEDDSEDRWLSQVADLIIIIITIITIDLKQYCFFCGLSQLAPTPGWNCDPHRAGKKTVDGSPVLLQNISTHGAEVQKIQSFSKFHWRQFENFLKQRGRPGGHGRDGDNSSPAVGTDANARWDNH